ncbi:MAG: hypothetical protein ABSD38_27885 [Syntrophorhabdales bacterium]|jgi:hypothetical protein
MTGGGYEPITGVTPEEFDTSILVVSCDKYRDLWAPFFTLFFRYWSDCPYQVYLCSNETGCEDERVKTILTGPDLSWSANLKRCLEKLPTAYFILFQEDFLLTKIVDTGRIRALVAYLQRHRAACLRLMPFPPPETMIEDSLMVGEISKGALYRVSLQTAIWEKDVLYGLLREGESPWDLESDGSVRSNAIDKPFLSICGKNRETWPLDYFGTAVVQGKWVRQAVALCAREGITVDKTKRAIESRIGLFVRQWLSRLRGTKSRFLAAASLNAR